MTPKPEQQKPRVDARRKKLIQLIHVAKHKLGLDDDLYRLVLQEEFGVESSTQLSNQEMVQLIERFAAKGFRTRSAERGTRNVEPQLEALRERIGQELLRTDLDAVRYRKLVFKVCGVAEVKWCKDVNRLKRLAAILKSIGDKGQSRIGETGNRRTGD